MPKWGQKGGLFALIYTCNCQSRLYSSLYSISLLSCHNSSTNWLNLTNNIVFTVLLLLFIESQLLQSFNCLTHFNPLNLDLWSNQHSLTIPSRSPCRKLRWVDIRDDPCKNFGSWSRIIEPAQPSRKSLKTWPFQNEGHRPRSLRALRQTRPPRFQARPIQQEKAESVFCT